MKLLFLFSVFSIVLFSSKASPIHDEDWVSKTFDIGEFNEIYLEGGFRVFLKQGNECSVTMKASDDDVFDFVNIKNDRDELRLKIDRKNFNVNRVKLYITINDLQKLDIIGGINLQTKGYLDLKDIELYVAGGSKVEMDLKAENIEIKGEGGVLFELDGVAKSLDVYLAGAGHFDAGQLKTNDVKIKIEGVGTSSVYATKTLDATISGVGKVKYRGNPKVSKHIDGLGSVKAD